MAEELQFNAEDFQSQSPIETPKKSSKWKYLLSLVVLIAVTGSGLAFWQYSQADEVSNDAPPSLGGNIEDPNLMQGFIKMKPRGMSAEFLAFDADDIARFEENYGEDRDLNREDSEKFIEDGGVVSRLETNVFDDAISYIHVPHAMNLEDVASSIDPIGGTERSVNSEGTGGFAIAYWDPTRVTKRQIAEYKASDIKNLGKLGKWVMTDNSYYPSIYSDAGLNAEDYIDIIKWDELQKHTVEAGQMLIIMTQRPSDVYGLFDGDDYSTDVYDVCNRSESGIGFYGFALSDKGIESHIEGCEENIKGIWGQTALGGKKPWEKIYARGEKIDEIELKDLHFVWVLVDGYSDDEGDPVVGPVCEDEDREPKEIVQAMVDGIGARDLHKVYSELPPTQQDEIQEALNAIHDELSVFSIGETDKNIADILLASSVIVDEHSDELIDFLPLDELDGLDVFLEAYPNAFEDASGGLEYASVVLKNMGLIARDFDVENISSATKAILDATDTIVESQIKSLSKLDSVEANEIGDGLLVYEKLMKALDGSGIKVTGQEIPVDEEREELVAQANEFGQDAFGKDLISVGEGLVLVNVSFSDELIENSREFGIDLPDGFQVPMIGIIDPDDNCRYWTILGAREAIEYLNDQVNAELVPQLRTAIDEALIDEGLTSEDIEEYMDIAEGISEEIKVIFEEFADNGEVCKFLTDIAKYALDTVEELGLENMVGEFDMFVEFGEITSSPQVIDLEDIKTGELDVYQFIEELSPVHGDYDSDTNIYTPAENYSGEDWLVYSLQTPSLEGEAVKAKKDKKTGGLFYCLDVKEGIDGEEEVVEEEVVEEEVVEEEVVEEEVVADEVATAEADAAQAAANAEKSAQSAKELASMAAGEDVDAEDAVELAEKAQTEADAAQAAADEAKTAAATAPSSKAALESANSAQASADAAQEYADAAKESADGEGGADEEDQAADAAAKQAEIAKTEASAAQEYAEAAQQAAKLQYADTAKEAAEASQASADAAQAAADTAKEAAAASQASADAGKEAASKASSEAAKLSAEEAQIAAEEAQVSADAAQEYAEAAQQAAKLQYADTAK